MGFFWLSKNHLRVVIIKRCFYNLILRLPRRRSAIFSDQGRALVWRMTRGIRVGKIDERSHESRLDNPDGDASSLSRGVASFRLARNETKRSTC